MDVVEVFGASYTTNAQASAMQDDAVNPVEDLPPHVDAGENPIQLESGGVPVSFVSQADAEVAAGPHYWGEAAPEDLPPPEPPPPSEPLFNPEIAPLSDRPWWSKARKHERSLAAAGGSA